MGIGSILAFGGPILAALVPYLMNPVTSLFDRIIKHSASTATGAVGSGVVGVLLAAFPCLGNTAGWQQALVAAIPLIFGALSANPPGPAPTKPG